MDSYKRIIITAVIAAAIGLSLGYLMFGSKSTINPSEPHAHHNDEGQTAGESEIWTCSMHPQIRQPEAGLCPICGMDLIPLERNSTTDPLVLEMTNEAVKLANIQTTVVGESMIQSVKSIRLTGKVQIDERQTSSLVAHIPGRIEKLFVTFTGEHVKKGQALATFYAPEIITAQRELLEALKLQELNPNLLEAARNKLRYWKIDTETINEIEASGLIQETFILYANESGTVTKKYIAVGDYLKQGAPLFDIVNLDKVWVLFDAYEEDLATISIGNKIEFTTPSIPNKTFTTKVTFIDPIINQNTRVAAVRTEVNNSNGLLKPEMFVNGSLQHNLKATDQLTVPKSAVMWTGIRSVVYVKMPNTTIPSFQFREVELGAGLGKSYQVISGLEIGEEVVTYGNFTIDAAAQLNNQASMMNRDVTVKGMEESANLPDYKASTPTEFKQQLAHVTAKYLLLKNAFIETDAEQATKDAKLILEAVATVDMSLLKGDAHLYWMDQLQAIVAHSNKIAASTNIEEQRKQFEFLSQALINSIKVYGTNGDTLYLDHCPMAFGNSGADWLSREAEIRNPYFGSSMMTCGIVQDTLH